MQRPQIGLNLSGGSGIHIYAARERANGPTSQRARRWSTRCVRILRMQFGGDWRRRLHRCSVGSATALARWLVGPLARMVRRNGVNAMATGWAGDGAVQDQIDATVKDGVTRAQSQLPTGPGLTH